MERCEERESDEHRGDFGSLLLVVLLATALVSVPSSDAVGLGTLLLVFLGPALGAWGAVIVLRKVSQVPDIPSLSLWLLCLAGSGMPFPIEKALSTRVPEGMGTVGVLGGVLFHFVEAFVILSASGTLIVGLTMIPVLWCVERGRSSFLELIAVAKCLVFFAVILLLARRAMELLVGL